MRKGLSKGEEGQARIKTKQARVEEIIIRKGGRRRRVTTTMKHLLLLENGPPGTQPASRRWKIPFNFFF